MSNQDLNFSSGLVKCTEVRLLVALVAFEGLEAARRPWLGQTASDSVCEVLSATRRTISFCVTCNLNCDVQSIKKVIISIPKTEEHFALTL